MPRSQKQLETYKFRRDNGLCVYCGKPAVRGVQCLEHAAMNSIYKSKPAAKKKRAKARKAFRAANKELMAKKARARLEKKQAANQCAQCSNPKLKCSRYCRPCRDRAEKFKANWRAKKRQEKLNILYLMFFNKFKYQIEIKNES